MSDKPQYRDFCASGAHYVPLFLQPWWMDTVCQGKQWDAIVVTEDGEVAGAMPFVVGRKLGLSYILQPQLTPWSGPWIAPGLDSAQRRDVIDKIAIALRDRKPRLCKLCLAPEVDEWQPFQHHSFGQTTRYTYRFPSIADVDGLYRSASRLRRRYDKGVAERCEVDRDLATDEFVPFHVDYYRRRGERDLIGEPLLRRVVDETRRRGQGLLWGLRDRTDGKLHAAWFVAYDERCSWSLLLAIGADAPRGAMSYLMWQMLHELSHRTGSFDFEGGMDAGLAFFYSSFGTVRTPYHCIYRSRMPLGKRLLKI